MSAVHGYATGLDTLRTRYFVHRKEQLQNGFGIDKHIYYLHIYCLHTVFYEKA